MLAALWLAGCLLLWIAPAKLPHFLDENHNLLPAVQFLQTILPPESIFTNLVCVALTILNSILLSQLNNLFTFIREKTFLLPLTFIILLSSFHSTHYNVSANLSLTFLLIAFFNFLKMYHNAEQTEEAFLGSLLISFVGWLFFPEFLLLFVAVWLGFWILDTMSLRIFLASIVGLATPAIFCLAFVPTYFSIFVSHFEIMIDKWAVFLQSSFNFQFFFICILLLLWILSLIGIFSSRLRDNVRTRVNLNFALFFFINALVIIICFPQTFLAFLPVMSALFAVFFAHPVTLRNSNFFNIVFIIFCGANVIYVLCNLIANYL
jgi:hypothetical protein